MAIKTIEMEQIKKEVKEYLDVDFEFDAGNFGGVAKHNENVGVRLLYKPVWKDWIEAMYWTCFATWNNGFEVDLSKIPYEKHEKFTVDYLKKRSISAALESAIFVIAIDNVPRSMTHQIVRHRQMSFSQEGYRVTPAHHANIRIPDGADEYEAAHLNAVYNDLRREYVTMIQNGTPVEHARNVLPMGTCTHIIMTTSMKALLGYVNARSSSDSQDEHTYITARILQELKTSAPEFYEPFFKNEKTEETIKKYLGV